MGDAICLFPEGMSRYHPTIAPLKTGGEHFYDSRQLRCLNNMLQFLELYLKFYLEIRIILNLRSFC
jgi:hypothetical protein